MKRNTVKNKTTSNEIQRQNHELMNFYILRAFYRCKKGKVRNDLSLLQDNVRIQAGGREYLWSSAPNQIPQSDLHS